MTSEKLKKVSLDPEPHIIKYWIRIRINLCGSQKLACCGDLTGYAWKAKIGAASAFWLLAPALVQ